MSAPSFLPLPCPRAGALPRRARTSPFARPSALAAAAFVAAALVSTGCGAGKPSDPYHLSMAAATRAQNAGRHAEAGQHYEQAAIAAKSEHDRAHLRYLGAMMRVESGDVEGALRALDVIAKQDPPTDASASAWYRAALLRVAKGDAQQSARGWADLEALLRAFPSHGVTRSALARIAQHKQETEGDAAALAWLEQGKSRYANTALEELFWYRTARHKHLAGQRDPAEREYLQLADKFPYPRGVHFDDALFYAAEVAVERKRPREAITYLERLLRERESAHLMGSYERPRYVPSQRKIAIIFEDELRDRAAARDAWHKLYASFTTSLERDDALFREAQLWKADGDLETACSRLRNLASTFPSSRYAPCAEDLCTTDTHHTTDANGEPKRKSCRDYLRRAWSEGTRLKDAAPDNGDAEATSAP